jgi:hypothetical protein
METDTIRRIGLLAGEIDRMISDEDGFVTAMPIRDEIIVKGDRTGLLTFAVLLLLEAIGDPTSGEISDRLDKMAPGGGSVTYLGAMLVSADDIRKERRSAKLDLGCLIVGIAITVMALILAAIGAIQVVRWML